MALPPKQRHQGAMPPLQNRPSMKPAQQRGNIARLNAVPQPVRSQPQATESASSNVSSLFAEPPTDVFGTVQKSPPWESRTNVATATHGRYARGVQPPPAGRAGQQAPSKSTPIGRMPTQPTQSGRPSPSYDMHWPQKTMSAQNTGQSLQSQPTGRSIGSQPAPDMAPRATRPPPTRFSKPLQQQRQGHHVPKREQGMDASRANKTWDLSQSLETDHFQSNDTHGWPYHGEGSRNPYSYEGEAVNDTDQAVTEPHDAPTQSAFDSLAAQPAATTRQEPALIDSADSHVQDQDLFNQYGVQSSPYAGGGPQYDGNDTYYGQYGEGDFNYDSYDQNGQYAQDGAPYDSHAQHNEYDQYAQDGATLGWDVGYQQQDDEFLDPSQYDTELNDMLGDTGATTSTKSMGDQLGPAYNYEQDQAYDQGYYGEQIEQDYAGQQEYVPDAAFQGNYAVQGEYEEGFVQDEYQSEYPPEGGYPAEGEYLAEGAYQGDYPPEGEYPAEGEYAPEGEYPPEGEYQSEYAPEGEYPTEGAYALEGGYQDEHVPESGYAPQRDKKAAEREYPSRGKYAQDGDHQDNYVPEGDFDGEYSPGGENVFVEYASGTEQGYQDVAPVETNETADPHVSTATVTDSAHVHALHPSNAPDTMQAKPAPSQAPPTRKTGSPPPKADVRSQTPAPRAGLQGPPKATIRSSHRQRRSVANAQEAGLSPSSELQPLKATATGPASSQPNSATSITSHAASEKVPPSTHRGLNAQRNAERTSMPEAKSGPAPSKPSSVRSPSKPGAVNPVHAKPHEKPADRARIAARELPAAAPVAPSASSEQDAKTHAKIPSVSDVDNAWGWGDSAEFEQETEADTNAAAAVGAEDDDAWGWNDDQDADVQDDVYAHDAYASQEYVPAPPSTAGVMDNDPMQDRGKASVPLAAFGIGGKLAIYLPLAVAKGDAFDYSSPHMQRSVKIHSLAHLVGARPFSTLDMHKFPGPLFEGTRVNHKQKKADTIRYLHEQISESASGIGYLRRKSVIHSTDDSMPQSDVNDWRRTEDKVLLLKLLVLLLEHDGKLADDPAQIPTVTDLLQGRSEATDFGAFNVPTYSRASSQSATKRPIRTYTLRQGFLEELQTILQEGDLPRAVDLALRERMWAHAMVLSQQLNKETRDRVMSEFVHHELDDSDADDALRKDYTSIKVAYGLYTDQTPEQIAELFRGPSQLSPEAQHVQWRQAVATLLSNRGSPNSQTTVLCAIGDGLMTAGLPEAAHVCYLLAHQHRAWIKMPEKPFLMLGTVSGAPVHTVLNDMDALLMTEVLEYAYSLSHPRNAEPYVGIPALAPYKIVMAAVYDELGDSARAKKYCDALINLTQTKGAPPLLTPMLQTELHQLMNRLNGTHVHGETQSWSKKLQRPTLDGVWGALEGRLTKFIAGEESAAQDQSKSKSQESAVGAFTHYSAITPEVVSIASETPRPSILGDTPTGGSYSADAYGESYVPQELSEPVTSEHAEEPYQGNYAEGDYAGGEYAEGDYQADYAEGDYAGGEYAEGDYAGDYAKEDYQGEYAEGDYTGGEYAEGNYQGDYAEGDYAEGDYQGDYAEGDYAGGEYTEGDYHGDYAEGDYAGGEYVEGDYHGDYAEGDVQGEYTEGNYPEAAYDENQVEESDSMEPSGDPDADKGETGADPCEDQDTTFTVQDNASSVVPDQEPQAEADNDADAKAETSPRADRNENDQEITPAAPPVFHRVESAVGQDGLLSTMPMPALEPIVPSATASKAPPPPSATASAAQDKEPDEDDDLGFGNTSHKKTTASDKNHAESQAKEPPKEPEPKAKPAEKSSGNSWLGRLLGSRSSSAQQNEKEGKAVRAHLGEETSFYYDKELKRWVNKKAGADSAAAPAALPPPPKKPANAPASDTKISSGNDAATKHTEGGPPSSTTSTSAAPDTAAAKVGPPAKTTSSGGGSKRRTGKPRYIVVD